MTRPRASRIPHARRAEICPIAIAVDERSRGCSMGRAEICPDRTAIAVADRPRRVDPHTSPSSLERGKVFCPTLARTAQGALPPTANEVRASRMNSSTMRSGSSDAETSIAT